MGSLSRVCVFLCFASVTLVAGRLEDEDREWKTQMERRMEEMVQMIQRQQQVIDGQTKTIEKQALEIKHLQTRVVVLEDRSKYLDRSDEILPDETNYDGNHALSNENQRLHNKVSKNHLIRRFLTPGEAEGRVSFYAYISKDFGHVGQSHVFLYDTIVTNYGNAYSQHTGAFTAPTTGVYAFCYTAYASGEHVAGESGDYGEVTVEIVHNGAYKGSIHVDTESNWEEEMATGFAILMLQVGDVVLTTSGGVGQGSFHSNMSGRWSFSGFQIA
ncbi:uncharacterized protein LOC144620975 [Crassostrea virginica]